MLSIYPFLYSYVNTNPGFFLFSFSRTLRCEFGRLLPMAPNAKSAISVQTAFSATLADRHDMVGVPALKPIRQTQEGFQYPIRPVRRLAFLVQLFQYLLEFDAVEAADGADPVVTLLDQVVAFAAPQQVFVDAFLAAPRSAAALRDRLSAPSAKRTASFILAVWRGRGVAFRAHTWIIPDG